MQTRLHGLGTSEIEANFADVESAMGELHIVQNRNRLLAEAQKLALDLQMALADMRDRCKCPDQ